jgi:electron transport complex, RnfABCDGE type, E subunit
MIKDFTNGIVKVNPIFVLALGLCPALAISTSIDNAIGMGAAVIFVLLFSNLMISLIRNVIPKEVRIPCFIVIIATFVTIVSLALQAYLPALNESLGIYVPLIVVNCIILGRAEAFASKNPVSRSVLDALGIGLGFTLSLIIISIIRELLGTGASPSLDMVLHFLYHLQRSLSCRLEHFGDRASSRIV